MLGQALENVGANLFTSSEPPQASTAARVEGGAIERSNVKAVLEMSRLMDVNRAYTSLSSMLSRMDELQRQAITRLADTNA